MFVNGEITGEEKEKFEKQKFVFDAGIDVVIEESNNEGRSNTKYG